MSIKEHLTNQPDRPDRLHDLTLESEERPELKFDVKRDIFPEDWKAIESELSDRRERAFGGRDPEALKDFAHLASRITVLDPHRRELVHREDIRLLEEMFAQSTSGGEDAFNLQAGQAGNLHLNLKILDHAYAPPDQMIADAMIGLNQLQQETTLLSGSTIIPNTISFYRVFRGRILAPDVMPYVHESLFKNTLDRLDAYRRDKKWDWFSALAAALKILDPARVKLSKTDFAGMLTELDSDRKNKNWNGFVALAIEMSILAADKVEFTDRGMKLTMPHKDFQQQSKQRPERKVV